MGMGSTFGEEICAVFGVPPILLSFGEAATYANLDAAKTALWEDRVVPLLDDLCQGYMGTLFPYWALNEADWRIRPDLSGVRALQVNLQTEATTGNIKAQMFKTLVDAGVPPNMAASAAGLPLLDIPGGDEPRQQAPPALTMTKARRPHLERKEKGEPAQRLKLMDSWAEELRPRVAELLLSQGNEAAAAYAAGQPWEEALSLDDWKDVLGAIHQAVIESEGAVAYSALLKAVTSGGGGGAFDVLADNVVGWIDSHVGDMVGGITDTSKAALRAEIKAGVEAGETVPIDEPFSNGLTQPGEPNCRCVVTYAPKG